VTGLSLYELERVARGGAAPALADDQRERLVRGRETVDAMVAEGAVVYGVTTGFGDLSSVRIDAADAAQLQLNLVRSHAIGVGEPLPAEVVRGMLLLLANSLSKGHSGVRPELVELLLALLGRDVLPVVPSRGSVGASGDLAPLAHIAVVLCGEGRATFGGEELDGGEALRRAGLAPIDLAAKEGLALINGTHLMAACGGLALRDARRLLDAAVVTAALSLEAFMGSTTPFDARIHDLRRHPGQGTVAARLRALLEGSAIVASHADCGRVQDPYTLRCVPQVLGAIADALDYVEGVLERELDSVTDNPLLFPDDGEACSGGNFHGQPLSLALDHLGLALCELASFAERRTYALLSPSYAGLPRFLTPHPGLSSGLMIAQYTQAALVNECQVLAHPAGAGSVPTSAGMEDFNSMGAWAALKARQIADCAAHVVAIELVCACQGIEFHRPLRSTPVLEGALAAVRERVPRLEQDRSLSAEVGALAGALRTGELVLVRGEPGP
jgi:histidine ammonia-lyase